MKFYLSICWQTISCLWIISLPSLIRLHELTEEDKYISHFGDNANNPTYLHHWNPLRNMYFNRKTDQMKNFCNKYHQLAGYGSLDLDKLELGMNVRELQFKNPAYKSRNIENLWYLMFAPNYTVEEMHYYFITEGLRPDCVYYLTPIDGTRREFYLDRHVCSVPTAVLTKKKTHQRKMAHV